MLWLLKAKENNGYDVADGFVIRADTPKQARKLASKECGGEGKEIWLRAKHSICRGIESCSGRHKVILIDFKAG